MHGIKVLMAKNYTDNLSEETRKGVLERARTGLWPSYAPLRYRKALREDGKRAIVPRPRDSTRHRAALQLVQHGSVQPQSQDLVDFALVHLALSERPSRNHGVRTRQAQENTGERESRE